MRSKIVFVNAADGTLHKASANAAIYPNLGLLTLMSELKNHPGCKALELAYFDGTVHGNQWLSDYITEHHESILGLCFSVLTSNYRASLGLAKTAKSLDPRIITVFGG